MVRVIKKWSLEWPEKFLGDKSTKSSNSWTAQKGTQEFSSQLVFECQDHHFQIKHRRNSPFLGLWVLSLSKSPNPYLCKLICSCQPWPSFQIGHANGLGVISSYLDGSSKVLMNSIKSAYKVWASPLLNQQQRNFKVLWATAMPRVRTLGHTWAASAGSNEQPAGICIKL